MVRFDFLMSCWHFPSMGLVQVSDEQEGAEIDAQDWGPRWMRAETSPRPYCAPSPVEAKISAMHCRSSAGTSFAPYRHDLARTGLVRIALKEFHAEAHKPHLA